MTSRSANLPLLDVLGISKPIIQAPMAGVSTPALAAAVSNAGGLGSLGVGAMKAEAARKAIRDTRALTDAPLKIIFFAQAREKADAAVEQTWLDWLRPQFAKFNATPPEKIT